MKINDLLKMDNRTFANTIKTFAEHCRKAGIAPSKRQAAKWRKHRGLAYLSKTN